ncbi:hypothetical protein ACLB2K_006120 [Fragaria x ananassa]
MATYRALLSLKSSLDDPDSRLSALSALRLLNLSNNVFNHTFPPELSNLTNLRVLDLYNNNHLTGVLPVSVAHMTNLRHLHLGGNFSLLNTSLLFVGEMDEDYETWNPYHGFMEDVNGNASNNVYTPEVADEYAPKVGQIFDSLEEVYEFYNNYAKMGGFGIRRHSQKTHKGSNDITRKEFVCYKQGNYEKKVDDKGMRSGCIDFKLMNKTPISATPPSTRSSVNRFDISPPASYPHPHPHPHPAGRPPPPSSSSSSSHTLLYLIP